MLANLAEVQHCCRSKSSFLELVHIREVLCVRVSVVTPFGILSIVASDDPVWPGRVVFEVRLTCDSVHQHA